MPLHTTTGYVTYWDQSISRTNAQIYLALRTMDTSPLASVVVLARVATAGHGMLAITSCGHTTTADWWPLACPKKYFLCFPYQNDETPLFYLRKLRVPLALRGSQNPKVLPVRGTLSKVPVVSCQKVPTFVRHLATPKKKIDTSRLPFPHEKNSPPDNARFFFCKTSKNVKTKTFGIEEIISRFV